MIKKYRKKPVVIEALQWNGKTTYKDLVDFGCENLQIFVEDPPTIGIPTLEGVMKCNIGDYIIKGVEGEFYPCKEGIFHKTYEEVKDNE